MQEFFTSVNHLQEEYPYLAEQWNQKKNRKLLSDIPAESLRRFWWRCKKGHEWRATVLQRIHLQGSCPFCHSRTATPGEDDLQTLCPHIAEEWNHERNEGISPEQITPGSTEKVWWKCSQGHEWQAVVKNRALSPRPECPYCHSKNLISGQNDLQTLFPKMAEESMTPCLEKQELAKA